MLGKFYRCISSMQLGLILLALIGLLAALGSSILPEGFYNLIFFKALLLLLLLNLLLCIANRLGLLLDLWDSGKGSTRMWIRHAALFLVHAGMVMILVGGSLNVYYGTQTNLSIAEGDDMDLSQIYHLTPPFSLRLNEFEIPYNDDGTPAQYYSHVTVKQENLPDMNFSISVNHPLRYRGIKFYQYSYGFRIKAKQLEDSNHAEERVFSEGEMVRLAGTGRMVKIFRYIPNYDPDLGMDTKTLRPDNPQVMFSVYDEEQNLLGIGTATWDEPIKIDDKVSMCFTGVLPYTVLTLKTDPGLPVVAVGGIMLMLGVVLIFLVSMKRHLR